MAFNRFQKWVRWIHLVERWYDTLVSLQDLKPTSTVTIHRFGANSISLGDTDGRYHQPKFHSYCLLPMDMLTYTYKKNVLVRQVRKTYSYHRLSSLFGQIVRLYFLSTMTGKCNDRKMYLLCWLFIFIFIIFIQESLV